MMPFDLGTKLNTETKLNIKLGQKKSKYKIENKNQTQVPKEILNLKLMNCMVFSSPEIRFCFMRVVNPASRHK